MMKIAYKYVKLHCGVCNYRDACIKFEQIQQSESINYFILRDMVNCPAWEPENKEKEGEI